MVARLALSQRAVRTLLLFGLPLVVLLICIGSTNMFFRIWMKVVFQNQFQTHYISIPVRLHACDYVCQQVEGTHLDRRVGSLEDI